MKKLFIFAAAAMAMAACTNQEEVVVNKGAHEISLGAYNYALSRNTPDDKETFNTNNTMYVTANYDADKDNTYAAFFEGKTFTHDGTAWVNYKDGSHSPIYYPLEGQMEFMAYSSDHRPTDLTNDEKWNALGHTCTVKFTTLNGYDDVLFSNVVSGVQCPADDATTLTFRHALAWVYFNFKANATNLVKVYSVTVNGAKFNGTATFNFGATPAPTVEWPAASLSDATDAHSVTGTTLSLNTEYAAWGNGVLVPTQDASRTITIKYTIVNDGVESDPMYYTYNGAATWAAGNKYIYKFNISPKEITVDAKVIKFTSVDDPDENGVNI